MHILLDVDGVVADFTGHLLKLAAPRLHPIDITDWNFFQFLTDNEARCARMLLDTSKFWETQPLIPGAEAGVAEFRAAGHDVVFVTSPWPSCKEWGYVRREWLKRHFGDAAPVIVTGAKEYIEGGIFIDDRPETVRAWRTAHGATGVALLFDAPYNYEARLYEGGDDFDRCSWVCLDPARFGHNIRHPGSWLA